MLLQVLDDGRITDSQGRTVDFKNTILIMTSNIGSSYLLDGIQEDGSIRPENIEMVHNELRAHFRPEFLNRLDEMIMFKPLTKENIGGIIELLIEELNRRLADQEISIRLTPAAKDFCDRRRLRSGIWRPSSETLSAEKCGNIGGKNDFGWKSSYRGLYRSGCAKWRIDSRDRTVIRNKI